MQTTYLLIAVLQACGGSVVLPDDWTTKCGMGKPNQGMDEPVALTKWLPEGGYKVYVTTLGEATAPRRNN